MNDLDKGLELPVIEEFYTIQGEGYHTGKAAYFIRVGGCDIGCRWCDTKFSWEADLHKLTKVDTIVNRVAQTPGKSIVVTGGEPLLYNLDYLCEEMKKKEIKTFIETSGSYPFSGSWDWVCVSPKKQSPPLPEAYEIANELKVIISDETDFIHAEETSKKVKKNCLLFLQPEWSNRDMMTNKIVDYVKQNPKWNISLQTHKFIKIP